MKMKKYALHWSAEIRGIQYVDAFDEQDAEEQFDSIKHENDIPDNPIHAELEFVEISKIKKKK